MRKQSDIKKIWQEASRNIQENNQLTRSSIIEAIEAKSKDVISQFVREKRTGLIAGIIVIPLVIVEILLAFPISWISILLVLLLAVAVILAFREGILNLRKIKTIDESGNLQENLSLKLHHLENSFRKSKILAPVVGIGFYLPFTLIYRYMEYGSLSMDTSDIIVLIISVFLIIALSLGIIRFQQYKYLQPLKECLSELEELSPPTVNKRLRINIGLVLAVLLIINLIIYLLVKVLN